MQGYDPSSFNGTGMLGDNSGPNGAAFIGAGTGPQSGGDSNFLSALMSMFGGQNGGMGSGSGGGDMSSLMSMFGGSGGSGGMGSMSPSMLSNIFNLFGSTNGSNDWKNPATGAMSTLQQISPTLTGIYGPYMSAGLGAMGNLAGQYSSLTGTLPQLGSTYSSEANLNPYLQQQYGQLSSNPSSVINQIGSTFHQSPGYGFQTQQATNAANQASAAGGMLGSPQEQQNLAGTVNNLANQDYYNYLNTGMGAKMQGLQGLQGLNNQGLAGLQNLYGTGVQGQQGMMGMGANMANQYGDSLSNMLASMANLQYQGQNNANQQAGGQDSSMMSSISSLLPIAMAAMSFL